jgi:hypothetical protein
LLASLPIFFCYFFSEYPPKAHNWRGETMARTAKLYRIESDGRRLAAGAIQPCPQDDLAAHWQLFLATAAQGLYVANYRGVQLGGALVTAAGKPVELGS